MVPLFSGVDQALAYGRLHADPGQNVVAKGVEVCVALESVCQAVFSRGNTNHSLSQTFRAIHGVACGASSHSLLPSLPSAAEIRALHALFDAECAGQRAVALDLAHAAVVAGRDGALLAFDCALCGTGVEGVFVGGAAAD